MEPPMHEKLPLRFIKSLFDKLDPDQFQIQFLETLMQIQNVERGSVWIRRGDRYVCTEAAGPESGKVKGMAINAGRRSIVDSVFKTGKTIIAEAGKDPRHFKEIENSLDVKSTLILCIPLKLKDGTVYGAVQIIDTSAGGSRLNLDADYLGLLEGLVTTGGIALSASLALQDQQKQNIELRRILNEVRSPPLIIGRSEALLSVLRTADAYADEDFPVLITGESGTGKELIAREIHRKSSRRDKPFMTQNCSAIPDTLLESELFGYMRGAFTGATKDKVGLFRAVRGGTVFLDEIGDMPLGLQAKILTVLQSNEIKPLGSAESHKVDMRIIAATNRNLTSSIERGYFREDLYFRLNVLPLVMPPLRDRENDIPLLINHFLQQFTRVSGKQSPKIAPEAMEKLIGYHWPGNIREMENMVKFLLTVARGNTIHLSDLPTLFDQRRSEVPESRPGTASPGIGENTHAALLSAYSWEGLERDYILSLLDGTKWNIAAAARRAGVKRSTFTARMKRRGITKS
jgi:transcriptional regulator with GAF, ATPase, and Fis domain